MPNSFENLMFRSSKVYVQIFRNKLRAINLETGDEVIHEAIQPFSNEQQVVSNLHHAGSSLQKALNDLRVKKIFAGITIVIQQMEGIQGQLNDNEKRVLRDIAEAAGAKTVYLIIDDQTRSLQEILQIIKDWK